MGTRPIACGVMLAAAAIAVQAKPLISANRLIFEADTVVEGAKDAISYTFRIRNTGDEPLTIKSVRPG